MEWQNKIQWFLVLTGVFVRRSSEKHMLDQCPIPTVKNCNGTVMVFGFFGSVPIENLVKIESILKKVKYQKLLKDNVISYHW